MNEPSDFVNPPAPRGFWQCQLRPTPEERIRMRRRDAWIMLVASYVALAFAYVFPQRWHDPSPTFAAIAWVAFMIRVFQFHLGLLVAVIVGMRLLRRQWRLALAALPILAFTLGPPLANCWPRATQPNDDTISVMSCNLLMINRETSAMVKEIAAHDADIILFQEYTDHWHTAIQDAIGSDYPHLVYFPREDSFGSAIYSKLPFTEKPTKYLPLGSAGEPQMRVVVEKNQSRIAIYNIHLLPPWGMAYIQENRRQFNDLLAILKQEKLPVILAGDFNFTESTPNAGALNDLGLRDAFGLGGWGRGKTWPAHGFFRWMPGLRLDHIYIASPLDCAKCVTGDGPGSDHRPIVAEISIRPKKLP